jgi:hypothetical protein
MGTECLVAFRTKSLLTVAGFAPTQKVRSVIPPAYHIVPLTIQVCTQKMIYIYQLMDGGFSRSTTKQRPT